MIDQMRKLLAPLQRRVMLMIGRAVITLVDDAGKTQRLQLNALAGETLERIERFQEYGFTSRPFAQAEAIVIFPAGNRSHGIAIAVEDRRYRLKGFADGEVAIYDDLGQKVHLTRTGIVIDGAGKTITIQNSPTVDMQIDLLKVRGDILDNYQTNADNVAGMRAKYNAHVHTAPGTNTPTPVM